MNMQFPSAHLQLTRREMFKSGVMGLGLPALASMLQQDMALAAPQADGTETTRQPHFPAKAKNVIFLHMVGAPSQLDLFDNKPVLRENDGKPCPAELLEGQRFAFLRGHPKLLGSEYKFQKHGESGLELSELLPHLGQVADDVSIVKTLHTELFNHAPAQLFFQTGFGRFGRPSMGSWVLYGLGSENQNLPGFVVMLTGKTAGAGNSLWGSGFLPTVYQGVEFRSKGDPVLFLTDPPGMKRSERRQMVDSVNALNQQRLEAVGDPEIATRISQYEMAFRMQESAPEVMNLADEPQHVLDMYGAKSGGASFANNCVMARRLVERGVRFVQLFDEGWDHHGSIFSALKRKTKQVDQPAAALVKDLKQRGMLDDTLVIFGGEFGRTPMLQADRAKAGRDHHKDAFSAWMAGGGIKGGQTIGRTDDLGYFPVEDPVSVHDWHATLLHLLGLDHKQLTYKYQGRDFRLTDVFGKVVEKLIA